jgi:hypothetical protein
MLMVENKSKIFYLFNSNYAHKWSPDRNLNNLSFLDMLSISKIKALNLYV